MICSYVERKGVRGERREEVEERKEKRMNIETVGHGNCNQGKTERWNYTKEPGKSEEEIRREQEKGKREEDIPLVRLCDSDTWPARIFYF